jgi:hypothetical protein
LTAIKGVISLLPGCRNFRNVEMSTEGRNDGPAFGVRPELPRVGIDRDYVNRFRQEIRAC